MVSMKRLLLTLFLIPSDSHAVAQTALRFVDTVMARAAIILPPTGAHGDSLLSVRYQPVRGGLLLACNMVILQLI